MPKTKSKPAPIVVPPKKRGRPPKPVEEGWRLVPLECLAANNYRKTFDPESLRELADSIRSVGILQPLVVRPREGGSAEQRLFEIVAGERRFRAAELAGMEAVPCVVRHLDDRQARECQLIENARRDGVPPLEEAAAYQGLVELGATLAEIAAKVGTGVSKVRSILSLNRIPPDLAKALGEGTVSRSTCELVCRIPDEQTRAEAADMVLTDKFDGPMNFQETRELIEEQYQVELKGAPFNRKDLKLYPEAGSCAACPKRTGNLAKEDESYKGSRADVCTDTACFQEKCRRQRAITEAFALDNGWKVLPDGDATTFMSGDDLSQWNSQYRDLDKPIPDFGSSCHLKPMLRPEHREKTVRELVADMKSIPVVLMFTRKNRPIYTVRSTWLFDTLRGLGLLREEPKPENPKPAPTPVRPSASNDGPPLIDRSDMNEPAAKPSGAKPGVDMVAQARTIRDIVTGWMEDDLGELEPSLTQNFAGVVRLVFRQVAGLSLCGDGFGWLHRLGAVGSDGPEKQQFAELAEWVATRSPQDLLGALVSVIAEDAGNQSVVPVTRAEILEFCEIGTEEGDGHE